MARGESLLLAGSFRPTSFRLFWGSAVKTDRSRSRSRNRSGRVRESERGCSDSGSLHLPLPLALCLSRMTKTFYIAYILVYSPFRPFSAISCSFRPKATTVAVAVAEPDSGAATAAATTFSVCIRRRGALSQCNVAVVPRECAKWEIHGIFVV